MTRREAFLFHLGVWCLQRCGRRVEYIEALEDAQNARVMAEIHERDAREARKKLNDLLRTAALVDGLLSSGLASDAQDQIRVGIINAGGIASARKPRSPQPSSPAAQEER